MENSAERGAVNSMLASGRSAAPAGAVLASALFVRQDSRVFSLVCDSELNKISNCQLQFATINKP